MRGQERDDDGASVAIRSVMQSTMLFSISLLALGVACTAPDIAGTYARQLPPSLADAGEGASGFPLPTGQDGGFPTIDGEGPQGPDSDRDGVPDPFDCDPNSSALGARIVEDDLATAKSIVRAAPGFDMQAWAHSNGAFRQLMLRDEADVALFALEQPVEDIVVDVVAASTEIGSFNPKLRQNFVVVGAVAGNGGFAGYGCGVEVVEGRNPEMQASIVGLSGSVTSIKTAPIKRADRDPLMVGEEFGINVVATAGTLTCTIIQSKKTTTISAQNLGSLAGSIGFFTRQSKAKFSNARVCKLGGAMPPNGGPPPGTPTAH